MKVFGTDTKPIFINFETDDSQYGLSFERDLLGNIKNVIFSKGEKGANGLAILPIKKIAITPKNKIDKIKHLIRLIKHHV